MSKPPNILIVESRFYEDIADELAKGAIAILDKNNATYERIAVPGVFETPAAVRFAIRSMEIGSGQQGGYSGFIVLGCVIRGETDHHEYINKSSIQALMDLTQNYSISLGFGILTCDTHEQAVERASVKGKNTGAKAAKACLRMVELKKDLFLVVR